MAASQTDRLHALLSAKIRTAQIKPGDLLAEPEVAAEYGVSRTPARETLRLLASEGWLQVLPRKGYLVRPLQLQDVAEVMDLRAILEPELAAKAAEAADDAFADRLDELVAEQHAEGLSREERLTKAEAFHLWLADGSSNARAKSLLRPLVDEISRLHHAVPRLGRHVESEEERAAHERIAAAVRAGDADATRRLVREHLDEFRSAIFEAF